MLHARTAGVVAVAALLASCSAQPERDAETSAPARVVQPTAPAAESKGITFAAVGDIMMGTDYPQNVLPDDDGVGFLAGVAPILSSADIAFGNLEGVLMDGGEAVKRCKPARKNKNETAKAPLTGEQAVSDATPPSPAPVAPRPTPAATDTPATADEESAQTESPRSAASELPAAPAPVDSSDTTGTAVGEPSMPTVPTSRAPGEVPGRESASETAPAPAPAGNCFVFRSPTRYAGYLRDAGLDVASLANNHAQDFGDAGRDSTMRTLDAVGIRHSGRDGDIAEWTTHGRRFALVAFAPNVGSHQLNDLVRAREIVTRVAARHDVVIVSFHGGGEGEGASKLPFAHEIYQREDRGDVVEFAHTVIDAGADLVIGHGPHVLRPLELYRGRLIAYSLGNFATYYGISVSGARGIAAVLVARLAEDGHFLDGRIVPTVQIRPAGPTPDPALRAVTLLRDLTTEAFPTGELRIEDDGRLSAKH